MGYDGMGGEGWGMMGWGVRGGKCDGVRVGVVMLCVQCVMCDGVGGLRLSVMHIMIDSSLPLSLHDTDSYLLSLPPLAPIQPQCYQYWPSSGSRVYSVFKVGMVAHMCARMCVHTHRHIHRLITDTQPDTPTHTHTYTPTCTHMHTYVHIYTISHLCMLPKDQRSIQYTEKIIGY